MYLLYIPPTEPTIQRQLLIYHYSLYLGAVIIGGVRFLDYAVVIEALPLKACLDPSGERALRTTKNAFGRLIVLGRLFCFVIAVEVGPQA